MLMLSYASFCDNLTLSKSLYLFRFKIKVLVTLSCLTPLLFRSPGIKSSKKLPGSRSDIFVSLDCGIFV